MTMTQTVTPTPLQDTLTRAAALSDYLKVSVGTPTGEDWFTPATFVDDEGVLETLWTRTAEAAKTGDRAYLKGSVFGSYIWMLTVSGVATYLLARRVPDLSARNTVLHVDEAGWIDALALKEPCFACLPDDPAANSPHAAVVPDLGTLRRFYLQGLLTEHLEAFMAVMKFRYKYGRRAMQETLADRIVGTLIWLLKEQGEKERIDGEVETFSSLLPFKSGSGVLEVPFGGRCEPFLKRASCCLSYRLPEHGYCTSCPLQSEEEQIARFQAYLANPGHD